MHHSKPLKTWWIQGWGSYTPETLVVVGGYTHDQITAIMKRIKGKKDIIAEWDKNKKDHDEKWLGGQNHGVLWHHESATVLWLKEFNNTWDNFDTIIHEVSHMVDIVLRDGKKMSEETEACAYQTEFLFREIRRKLFKKFNAKPKSKKRTKVLSRLRKNKRS